MPLSKGQSLGRYYVLEQLGEGGMATVYKAFDTRLERDVAIKIMRVDQFAPAMLTHILKRFEREAKAMALLTHPNIVHINDYGEQDGVPFLVMDYLPGGTLKEKLGRPIPWQEAVKLLLPIAEALAYAHQHNILHRDVKPGNILMTENDRPMLTDFGIAKILDLEEGQTLTGTGVGIGTPEYMSPEQGMGRGVDARTDIYSLGVVLYELITGRKPFTADTPMAVVDKHVHDPLPRPSQMVKGLPDAVEKVLLKLLAKRPEDRYPIMSAVIEALEGLKSGAGVVLAAGALSQHTVTQPAEQDSQVTMDAITAPVSTPKKRSKLPILLIGIVAGLGGLLCLGSLMAGVLSIVDIPGGGSDATETVKVPNNVDVKVTQETIRATAAIIPSATPDLNNPAGKIVFTCQISRQSEANEICLLNVDGTGFTQLTNNGANNNYPSMSPEGRNITFSSDISGSFQVYELNLDTYSTRQLTYPPGEASAPDISPDGNEIVYKHGDQIDTIWVMNREGSNSRQIGNKTGWDPVWSPDGSQILFSSGSYEQPQLFVMDADGSNLRQLTNMDNLRGRSDWSSSGLIATYSGLSNHRSIYVMNEDGTDVRQISTGGNSLAPSFSPDGNWIAFTGYIDHPGDENGCEIYVMRVDGSDIRRLTKNNYCDWQPRWGL
jgi:serine/threonine protein kinase